MKKKLLLATFLAAAIGAGAANAMDVATYLAKGEILRAKGMTAMFSSGYQELQAEGKASMVALKRERLAAQRAGRRAAYCPPGPASLNPQEIFAVMNAIPAARRPHVPVKDAIRAAFVRKYPCPG
jgi:hypothetical protein